MTQNHNTADDLPTHEEIRACNVGDIDLLKEWLEDATDIAESIRAQINAQRLTGTLDRVWATKAATKLAHAETAIKRIERRLDGFKPAEG